MCDEEASRLVVYTDDDQGLPAYAGQALITGTCSGCHDGSDLSLASDGPSTERLRRLQDGFTNSPRNLLGTVYSGSMPPTRNAPTEPSYRSLPALQTPEGREILRNWLACGAPVVERITENRPAGVVPVGAVVPAHPRVPPEGCGTGLTDCSGTCVDSGECTVACVDTNSNAGYCGACGNACDANAFCVAGTCAPECPAGTTGCNRVCITTDSDSANCGGCAIECGAYSMCAGGTCACEV
ncbi:MAG: hypothetical protein DRJ42_14490, partial [Deltaproteobacteria bacterium]